MRTIMPTFDRFPEEGKIVGRLVVGYGELEFDLAWAAAWLSGEKDTAFKVIFRAPGEKQRLLMADALVRGRLSPGKLRTRFEQAIAAMDHCRKIRNQYAHCNWGDDVRGLWFVNLEENADRDDDFDLTGLSQHVVSLPLLRDQEGYFCYVADCLRWLCFEGQVVAGEQRTNPLPAPRSRAKPKMHG